MGAEAIEFREGTRQDFEFLWQLQCEAMRPSVERQFGPWDDRFQRELFESSTDPTSHEIIELGGTPIGCQWVRSDPDAFLLERLHVLPANQGHGIGTHCIERLIASARAANLPVRLQVFRTSPARVLYLRLGFGIVSRTKTHETMEYAT